MSKVITMPQLSQTTDEVRLIKWLVELGQNVKRGQALCEVETDKTNMELESFESGYVLKLLAESGQMIFAGQAIAVLGEKNEKAEEDICQDKKINTEEQKTGEQPVRSDDKPDTAGGSILSKEAKTDRKDIFLTEDVKASAIVKNIAKIKNIDLHFVKGTGPQKIITKDDLERFIKESTSADQQEEYILSDNQMAAARNLTASKSEIPHYYIKTNICADSVLKWRENNTILKSAVSSLKSDSVSKISMYAILISAVADALKKFPKLNGYFRENKIVLRKNISIGFAVAQGEELFVPVVKNADSKSIFEIDTEIKSLIAKAGLQRFDEGDLSGGTFTISNLGMFDVDEFCAIISPPQAGILAVGKIRKALYVDEFEKISIRNEFSVTGSFDHRIVNGKSGAEFLQEFKKTIEEKITQIKKG